MEKLIWAHETLTNIVIDYVNKLDPVNDKEYIDLVFDVCTIAKEAIRQQIYNEREEINEKIDKARKRNIKEYF